MKNIIKSKGERKMELYILMGLAAVIIILEAVILLKAKKDDGREQTDEKNEQNFRRMEGYVAGEFQRNRSETAESLKEMNALIRDIQEMNTKQSDKLNVTLTESVQRLQQSNEKKLDEMRQTVDEKLTDTLSKRLDSSFKVVSEQLKSVHESLGEMHKLAGSVGDLQRVLTNVKSRGTWAEVQLGNILEQTLTKEQYECNVSTKNDTKRVEFAIKIPSRTDEGKFVWLPIDSKFPQEDYIRICEAAENADKAAMEAATRALEQTVKNQAKTIAELYIDVPKTTDFAIMFLATEGLYAEVLRRPAHRRTDTLCRVLVAHDALRDLLAALMLASALRRQGGRGVALLLLQVELFGVVVRLLHRGEFAEIFPRVPIVLQDFLVVLAVVRRAVPVPHGRQQHLLPVDVVARAVNR